MKKRTILRVLKGTLGLLVVVGTLITVIVDVATTGRISDPGWNGIYLGIGGVLFWTAIKDQRIL